MSSRSQSIALVIVVIFSLSIHALAAPSFLGSEADSVQRQEEKKEQKKEQMTVSGEWTRRRVVGLIFSTLIPGSGQSYLGHTEKGAAFTLATFGSALVAGLSESNVVGRNERLDELKSLYRVATSYVGADSIWSQMVETKGILDKDTRRRDVFIKLAVALWVANVLDYLFFTEDKGEKTFGFLPGKENSFALVPDLQNGLNARLTIRF